MEDRVIIELYEARDERAIRETADKYESYCMSIAENVLSLRADCEECVNDAYLKLWNSIPPQKPSCLRAYLAKIVRNICLTRHRENTAQKRGGGESVLPLHELDEILCDTVDIESEHDRAALCALINRSIRSLPKREQRIFVLRYFYMDSTKQIAAECGIKESNVLTILSRTRKKLREELEKGGYIL